MFRHQTTLTKQQLMFQVSVATNMWNKYQKIKYNPWNWNWEQNMF